MVNKLLEGLQQAGGVLKEQAGNIGGLAKDKTYQIIEDWLKIFPDLEKYGLEITSFGLSVGLSPALNVEMKGKHEDFSLEKLEEILEESKDSTALTTIFSSIKTTYGFHQKAGSDLQSPLLVKLIIAIPPEVRVYIGKPEIF